MRTIFIVVIVWGAIITSCSIRKTPDYLSNYNVVWDSQSKNAGESMPVGGGDIGVNVWVENNELFLYMDRSGFFDENNTMLKPGRFRIRLDPNPFSEDIEFRQELKLKEGEIQIDAKDKAGNNVKIIVWVEIFRPIVHVEVESKKEINISANYESWRLEKKIHEKTWNLQQKSFAYLFYDGDVYTYPDVINAEENAIWFYHRNPDTTIFDIEVKQQALEGVKDQMWDPMSNRTFGGVMFGEGLVQGEESNGKYGATPFHAWSLKSEIPKRKHELYITLHVDQTETVDEWMSDLIELKNEVIPETNRERIKHQQWWEEFWSRGYISINPENTHSADTGWRIGRNYQLIRFMQGCNTYGGVPTKFNGHLFIVDPMYSNIENHNFYFVKGAELMKEETPDFRMWGGGSYTAQNQRLVYWPMIKNGDLDMILPQFNFYKNGLVNAELRTKVYWGHEGASFTEQMNFYGLPLASHYGWYRPKDLPHGDDVLLRYLWSHQLEFAFMILEYERFFEEDISEYMPFIKSAIKFFDNHYQYRCQKKTGKPLDENGKLVISPSIAVETYYKTVNPTDIVAGMTALTQSILQLDEKYLDQNERKYFKELEMRLPDIRFRKKDGKICIAPAHSWDTTRTYNVDFPQLYVVFPYHIYGLGKPGLDTAINTWKYGYDTERQKTGSGWQQGIAFCARMGLTRDAKKRAIIKFDGANVRFPAFYGPDFDWLPDMNKAGIGMIGLQEMLMQTSGKEIRLIPAWPKEWDVDFKLYAPYNTSVEGKVRNGELIKIIVSPKSREKDIIIQNKLN